MSHRTGNPPGHPPNNWRPDLVWSKREGVWGWHKPKRRRAPEKPRQHKPTGRPRGRPRKLADQRMRMIDGKVCVILDRRRYWRDYYVRNADRIRARRLSAIEGGR